MANAGTEGSPACPVADVDCRAACRPNSDRSAPRAGLQTPPNADIQTQMPVSASDPIAHTSGSLRLTLVKLALSTFFACTLALSVATGQVRAEPCHSSFTFKPKPSLDLAAISRLSARGPPPGDVHLEAKDGGQLIVWPFDVEDQPTFGQWRAIALVFVTRGNLGEDTVGGLLLQARSEPPASIDNAALTKGPSGLRLSLPTAAQCPRYVIELDNNGGLVAEGRLVGRLR